MAKSRKTHCKYGHELSGDNLYVSPKGARSCRMCQRDRERKYDMMHREQRRIKTAKYLKQNPDYAKEYRETHRESAREYWRNNYQNDPEFRKRHINNSISRRKENIQVRLADNLRIRLRAALKGNFKSGSAVSDLGCSISELKLYIESQFQIGMSWDNWGKGNDKWHIDHILPLNSFDLTDREQLLKACHYINLQPL